MDTLLSIGLSESAAEAMISLGIVSVDTLPDDVKALLAARQSAREDKEWDRADEVRKAINMLGYLVEDTPEGPRVTKV